MDPNEIGQGTGRAIDIDRALTSAAGEAYKILPKDIFGRGNPTFLLVINHRHPHVRCFDAGRVARDG